MSGARRQEEAAHFEVRGSIPGSRLLEEMKRLGSRVGWVGGVCVEQEAGHRWSDMCANRGSKEGTSHLGVFHFAS